MTLQQKLMDLVGQWHGLDATERTARQEQLANELISVISEELAVTSQKPHDPTPFCAFCATRYMDNLVTGMTGGRNRSAA